MAKSLVVFSLLLLLLISPLTADPNTPNPKPSPSPAHTDLTNYGFPIGLLPTAVKNYTINRTTGDFIVDLGGACKVTLPSDNVATYSKKITGKIVVGKIANINGISVRAFFRWQSITGIRSSGDNLVFQIGTVSVKYPIKNFYESPACEGRHSSQQPTLKLVVTQIAITTRIKLARVIVITQTCNGTFPSGQSSVQLLETHA